MLKGYCGELNLIGSSCESIACGCELKLSKCADVACIEAVNCFLLLALKNIECASLFGLFCCVVVHCVPTLKLAAHNLEDEELANIGVND